MILARAAVVSRAGGQGRYVLPAPAGVESALHADDNVSDLHGTFAHPTLVQITPITDTGPGLDLEDYPYLADFDPDYLELAGAVKLDFAGTAQKNIDIAVPARPGDAAADQFFVFQRTNVSGISGDNRLSFVDQAHLDAGAGTLVSGCEISGAKVDFVPDIRMHYDKNYRFRVFDVKDRGGNLEEEQVTEFKTFKPRILQHIDDIDARDVVAINGGDIPGGSPCTNLIAVAEGDRLKPDDEGGIRIFDVTDLSEPPKEIGTFKTAGEDRGLSYVTGPVTTADMQEHPGPFLMSVDGEGDSGRFGVWRMLELKQGGETIESVATRFLSQSDDSYQTLLNDPQAWVLGGGLNLVPLDLGIPTSVATLSANAPGCTPPALCSTVPLASYTATIPNLGAGGIVLGNMDTGLLTGPQIDASIPGHISSVAAHDTRLLLGGINKEDNILALTDAGLNLLGTHTLTTGGDKRINSVLGLPDWQTRPELGSRTTETRHYAAALVDNTGVVLMRTVRPQSQSVGGGASPLGPDSGTPGGLQGHMGGGGGSSPFLPEDSIVVATPGDSPSAARTDAEARLLYVADGLAGLTIVDLSTPKASRDDDADGIDDRVLGTVVLPDTAPAMRLARGELVQALRWPQLLSGPRPTAWLIPASRPRSSQWDTIVRPGEAETP